MTTETVSVAALVVSYNTSEDLRRCVESLRAADVEAIEILDNCSTDPAAVETLQELVRESQARGRDVPQVRAHLSVTNSGFGGGINELVRVSGAHDYFWFVNPDAVVQPNTGSALAQEMRRHGLAIASPLIRTGGGSASAVWFAGGTIRSRAGMTEHLVDADPSRPIVDSEFITGAAMMVSAAAFAELGGFDESLFLYWEDADLVLRARSRGMVTATVTSLSVWHREGGSSAGSGFSRAFYYFMNRNRLLVCGDTVWRRLAVVAGPGARYSIRLWAGAVREEDQRWRKIAACARGVWDGLLGRRGRGAGW